ncbi:NADPH:quinone reductase-like Zn-dependent oxidoreductase [Nocardia tenerifensis]|uniref:NADPH:quinone reductase-like Zn-dependent oxidoreductase n=1 Tax=Nocardia tenerifensis TaxID=228006 RepID=A0A318KJN9_9NOCA|nr:NAD(P)-dependent alcohol dehydrogenase [Nocardia tenerifensis]PXX61496.1 NADPH:quinone reductase-like Zn-dependent oxidoreductase [Nocardia tenerifensis]
MKGLAYHLDPLRGLAGLTTAAQEVPQPGPDQVVMRVRAASINRRDLMLMDGVYPLPATPGIVPLSDGVGEVIAVGDNVTRAAVGDRITASYFVRWIDGPQRLATAAEQYGANFDGMLATYAVLEQDSVVHVPAHLTDVEAATLTCAGVVAWAALTKPVPVAPGETVLTVGTGPVALFAVQHAKTLGARVFSVTSSPGKAEGLGKLGADEVLVSTETPDWDRAVQELTGGDGVEHVVDAVGLPTLSKSVRAGGYNTQITMIGAAPTPVAESVGDVFGPQYVSIRRIAVGSRTDFEAMNRSISEHRVRPLIDRVFPLHEAVAAYRYFRDGNPFGKVVVELP